MGSCSARTLADYFALQVASSRSEDALAALSEAKDRRSEILKLEANLVELAALFQQV
jgi:t-SNARE complex subunit (syntaxin)